MKSERSSRLRRALVQCKGNARAVEVGIKVLDHAAKIQGYAALQRHELTGKDGKPLTLVQLLEAIGPIPDEE
jgi:hypothetical protein